MFKLLKHTLNFEQFVCEALMLDGLAIDTVMSHTVALAKEMTKYDLSWPSTH